MRVQGTICLELCVLVDRLAVMLVPGMMLRMMHDVMMMIMMMNVVPVMDRLSSACAGGKYRC